MPLSVSQAHGEPVVTADPTIVTAGSETTVTGSEMEEGEIFAIYLEGMFDTYNLGEVSVSGEEFTINVTIPDDVPPGLYTLHVNSEDGEGVGIEITILASESRPESSLANEELEPSAEKMVIERSRTVGDWIIVGTIIIVGGLGGIWLINNRK